MWNHLLKVRYIFCLVSYKITNKKFSLNITYGMEIQRHHHEVCGKCFSKQAPSGELVARVLMSAAFLRSSCTRLLYLALQSKMLRSMAGRSQGQSAMTGRSNPSPTLYDSSSSSEMRTNTHAEILSK